MQAYSVTPNVFVIASEFPVPGIGFVPINAFVLKGKEPILVDTGAGVESDAFMTALQSVIDPQDLRWLWLSHTDFDHIGSLGRLLQENAQLRVVTNFTGMGIMSLSAPFDPQRVYFLNPGETLKLADRELLAFKPPAFDNPCTTGFLDKTSGVMFTSDCFGAALEKIPQRAEDIEQKHLQDAQIFWATFDTPWIHKVDQAKFGKELNALKSFAPSLLLSSHLPPALGAFLDHCLNSLAKTPSAKPFVGPNQQGLEAMLKQMSQASR